MYLFQNFRFMSESFLDIGLFLEGYFLSAYTSTNANFDLTESF
jgi:hypothetical protein